MSDCLFCKIAAGDIPADILYEDDDVVAFRDIAPQAPVHFLVIPRRHLATFAEVGEKEDALIGKMMRVGAAVAAENGIGNGFRVTLNNGADAGQLVFHLHMHVLGGRDLGWPPG